MDEYQRALDEMKQAQNEYPPERIAHDVATEIKELLIVINHFKKVPLEDVETLNRAMLIARRLANA